MYLHRYKCDISQRTQDPNNPHIQDLKKFDMVCRMNKDLLYVQLHNKLNLLHIKLCSQCYSQYKFFMEISVKYDSFT